MNRPNRNDATARVVRKIAVVMVGTVLAMVGVVLVFTPGPAIVVLTLALAVMATEFAWARRWLRRLREEGTEVARGLGLGLGDRDEGDGEDEGAEGGRDRMTEGALEHRNAESREIASEPNAATRRGDPS